VNLNGVFTMAATGSEVTITGTNAQNENQVEVVVVGTKPEDITTTVSNTGT
jgi:hypothetical protein